MMPGPTPRTRTSLEARPIEPHVTSAGDFSDTHRVDLSMPAVFAAASVLGGRAGVAAMPEPRSATIADMPPENTTGRPRIRTPSMGELERLGELRESAVGRRVYRLDGRDYLAVWYEPRAGKAHWQVRARSDDRPAA